VKRGDGAAVAFDIGGVLIDWNPRYLYRKVFGGDEAAMERFLSEVCTPVWNARLDAGRSFAEGIAELIREHPGQARRSRPTALAGMRCWAAPSRILSR
jgi:hypothetical protein